MPWTLQHPAPCVRCTDSCSGGLGRPPSFILKWELKATPEQPALTLGGLSPCGGPLPRSWEGCVLGISLPTTSNSALRGTCKPERHLCPYLSKRQHPSGPFEEPPVSPICSVRHFCAWEKKKSVPGSLGAWSAAGSQHHAPSSLSPFPAASSAGAPPPGAWVWCRAGQTSMGRKLLSPWHNGHSES